MIINSKIYNIPCTDSIDDLTEDVKLVVISNELTQTEQDLLQKMLSATGLSSTEFMHIIPKNKNISLNSFVNQANELKIISFDLPSVQLGLQVQTQRYRVFSLQNLSIVIVDDLTSIGEEVNLKKFIWNVFKSWFINDK